MKPVLLVTNYAPPYRAGAFQRLNERESVELALYGGRVKHGGALTTELPRLSLPHRHVREREVFNLAASGRYRAVVVPTGGRVAMVAAWAGARRAGVPVIVWASLWAHPRSVPHAFSFVALRRLYRSADAIVTYGPHVSEYVCARGAGNVHVAPQSIDNSFWSSADVKPPEHPMWPARAEVKFLFAGRPAREKGLGVLAEAWRSSGFGAPTAALVLVGAGSTPPWVPAGGAVGGTVVSTDPVRAEELRNFYAAADVLVMPSIQTRTFREPWGLVVNEAMSRGLAIIASDAVGAVAGGLVRHERNGLVVPAGDVDALATAMRRMAHDPELRARLGSTGREDVAPYTHEAWAKGFSRAFASVGVSRDG